MPPFPPGTRIQHTVTFGVTFGSDLASFNQSSYINQLAQLLNVDTASISLDLVQASVLVTAAVRLSDNAAATTTAAAVSNAFSNASAASAAFGVPVEGFTTPQIGRIVFPAPSLPPTPPSPPPPWPPTAPPPLAPIRNNSVNLTDVNALAMDGDVGTYTILISLFAVLAALGWLGCLVVLYWSRRSYRRTKIAPDRYAESLSRAPSGSGDGGGGDEERGGRIDEALAKSQTSEQHSVGPALALSFSAPAIAHSTPSQGFRLPGLQSPLDVAIADAAERAELKQTAAVAAEPSKENEEYVTSEVEPTDQTALGTESAEDGSFALAPISAPTPALERRETPIEQARREAEHEKRRCEADLRRGWMQWLGMGPVLQRIRTRNALEEKASAAVGRIVLSHAVERWRQKTLLRGRAMSARETRQQWHATGVLRARYLTKGWNAWRMNYEASKHQLRMEWLVSSRWSRYLLASSFQAWLAAAGTVLEMKQHADEGQLVADVTRTMKHMRERREEQQREGKQEEGKQADRTTPHRTAPIYAQPHPRCYAENSAGSWAHMPPTSPLHYLDARIPVQGLGAVRAAPVMSRSGHKMTLSPPPASPDLALSERHAACASRASSSRSPDVETAAPADRRPKTQ